MNIKYDPEIPEYIQLINKIIDNLNNCDNYSNFINIENVNKFLNVQKEIEGKNKLILEYICQNNNSFRIIGSKFYKNNKNQLKMIIDQGKIENPKENYTNKKEYNIVRVIILPKKKNFPKDMSDLFEKCIFLKEVVSISK